MATVAVQAVGKTEAVTAEAALAVQAAVTLTRTEQRETGAGR